MKRAIKTKHQFLAHRVGQRELYKCVHCGLKSTTTSLTCPCEPDSIAAKTRLHMDEKNTGWGKGMFLRKRKPINME